MLVLYKARRYTNVRLLGIVSVVILVIMYLGKQGFLIAHNNDNLLRLHVIANSDSPADQQLKLQVRDALIPLLQQITNEKSTASEVATAVAAKQAQLTSQAAAVVSKAGFSYPVRVELGVYPFEAKKDDRGVRLPSGHYNALKVVLGRGEGRNWWCILFPPLCFGPDSVEVASSAKIQWRWRFWPRNANLAYASVK